jgi:hypothetical protein
LPEVNQCIIVGGPSYLPGQHALRVLAIRPKQASPGPVSADSHKQNTSVAPSSEGLSFEPFFSSNIGSGENTESQFQWSDGDVVGSKYGISG